MPRTTMFSAPSFPVRPSCVHNYNVVFSQESCCTQAVPSPRRQFPPLGGIQLPECSPFFTLGVGRAPRDSSRSTSDHVPGSGITSLVGHRCAVGIVRSNAGGRFWLNWNSPPLTAAPSMSTFCEQGNSPVASVLRGNHQSLMSNKPLQYGW